MRFDYYSATVNASPAAAVHFLRENLPYRGLEMTRERGVNSFEYGDTFRDALGDTVCTVLHGGVNPLPHVRASGVYAPDVAGALRSLWPEHSVSRVDAAVDFDGPGAFDKLMGICADTAHRANLKYTMVGDFRPDVANPDGRTVYVGSRQSPVMVRCYEKGKELIAKGVQTDIRPSLDLTRLEIEVKPQKKPGRLKAACLSPVELWGCAPWSKSILHRADGTDVERVQMNIKRHTDDENAIYHMARQYRSAMEAVIALKGSPEAFMEFVQGIWRADDEGAVRPSVSETEHTRH